MHLKDLPLILGLNVKLFAVSQAKSCLEFDWC